MHRSPTTLRRNRFLAYAISSLFLLGFFYPPVGVWTGLILAVWFIGTQNALRGFLWQGAILLTLSFLTAWRYFPLRGLGDVLPYFAWVLVATVFSVLPLSLHRMVGGRMTVWTATLLLPLLGVAFAGIAHRVIPFSLLGPRPSSVDFAFGSLHVHLNADLVSNLLTFLTYWFAAAVVCLWNQGRQAHPKDMARILPFALLLLSAGYVTQQNLPALPLYLTNFEWFCAACGLILTAWSIALPAHRRSTWGARPQITAVLRSPASGAPLRLKSHNGKETLVSSSGESFPILNEIAVVLRPEDLMGLNGKYNRLYQVIGGMYDDAQRVVGAFAGIDRDAYVMSYLGLLEVKPGDRVLETSVGTGLNFQYLPRGVQLTGLDLSVEMLRACRENLRRWGLQANLLLGNAECLPFADESFDVVFHVGGINFFNDRAKAMGEMIRVAKPGSRLLIADETEEHVKASFEAFPISGELFKDRPDAVSAPVDLLPADMEEVRLDILNVVGKNRFYALTFRKPASRFPQSESNAAIAHAKAF